MILVGWLLLVYLIGAIPTSYLAAKYGAGIDLRQHGSKNLGATNVYRVLGWKFALPVAAFDVLKGAFPVIVLSPRAGPHEWIPLVIGSAAVLGHAFSIFVRFKGGKGVATAAGVVLALAPMPLGVAAAVWAILVWVTGYVSLGSMIGALVFPVAVLLTDPNDRLTFVVGVAMAAFIIFTHRGNISRLLAGTESRFRTRGSEQ